MQFLSNLTKIPSKKTADIILQMPMSFVFFQQVDLLRDMMNFNKIFGKNIIYDDIKSN